MSGPVVRLRSIVKRYPRVLACDRIDLDLQAGEVHSLMGENGAGKSTLAGVLAGIVTPDRGSIEIDGRPVRRLTPVAARRLGIGMVHQHFRLVLPFTVAENVVLGDEPRRAGLLDRRRAEREVADLAGRLGLPLDPRAIAGELPVGLRQRVEIVKALRGGARILILDEPTAVLAPSEASELAATVRTLSGRGTTVLFVSHRLREVLAVSDRVSVLRRGRLAGVLGRAELDPRRLACLMVGRDLDLDSPVAPGTPGPVVLRLAGLSAAAAEWRPGLREIDLEVRQGEIMGIAGVEGNGQTELAEVVAGLRPATGGRIELAGRDLTGAPVRERFAAGLAHIPEDRLGRGLVAAMSAEENAILGRHRCRPFARRGWLQRGEIRRHFAGLAGRLDLRPPDPSQAAGDFSGGNQQKLVLGRELARRGRLLLAAQPTRGLDVGAIETVHRAIVAERDRGAGVLLISADLDEVVRLSDRVAVMVGGRIAGRLERAEISNEHLGWLMAGGVEHG